MKSNGTEKRGAEMENGIKVFIPVNKRKFGKKDLSRGLWKNQTGRIESDLIDVKNYNQSISGIYYQNNFFNYLDNLKQIKTNGKTQECIFYKNGGVGYIYYSRDKIEILPSRIIKEVSRADLKQTIKTDLKENPGLTIYRNNGKYYIEIFKTI
jgi:hypothetical protein